MSIVLEVKFVAWLVLFDLFQLKENGKHDEVVVLRGGRHKNKLPCLSLLLLL